MQYLLTVEDLRIIEKHEVEKTHDLQSRKYYYFYVSYQSFKLVYTYYI